MEFFPFLQIRIIYECVCNIYFIKKYAKEVCVCVCFVFGNMIKSSLISFIDIQVKELM